jgi:Aerotolerance regulator N-terminal
MGLNHPDALALLAAVPALVLAYLARERPMRVVVSSVLAFRALRGPRAERFRGRPRFPWTFWIELALLCLAVLAIAGPYVVRRQRAIALVLDNSAAMQARTASGHTRFDETRDKLAAALSSENDVGEIAVYVTAPEPHRVADPFDTVADARDAITRSKVTDAPDEPSAVARLLGQLASGTRFAEVVFAGANPLSTPIPPRIRAIAVGGAVRNYAIGSFALRRESFGTPTLSAHLTIANFSESAQTLRVAITGDGRALASSQAHLSPGEVGSLEFSSLAPAQVYRAELQPSDAFPLDNLAYATAGSVKSVTILFVSPTPGDAAGLSSLPGVIVTTRTPDQFSPADLADADLAIFEYGAPKQLPPANTMLVMPPPGDPVFGFATASTNKIQITSWRTPDPLTDSVNFRMLETRRGEYFDAHRWMEPVVSGAGGGLILAGNHEGHRYVAVGFNPFPYLGRANLPMSVLTLNMLSYLAGLSSEVTGFRTGDPWPVPAGVEKIVLPSGREVSVKPGALFTAEMQGIYELVGPGGSRTPRAVNLADLAASDLQNMPALGIETPPSATAAAPLFEHKTPLAADLLAAILILALAQALVLYRRKRPAVQPQP